MKNKITIDNICNQPRGSFKKFTAAKKVAAKLIINSKQKVTLSKKDIDILLEYSEDLRGLVNIATI